MFINTIIESTGSYLPTDKIDNKYFLDHKFLDTAGKRIQKGNAEIIQKLEEITQIEERRYEPRLNTAEMASKAAEAALQNSSVAKEDLGGIIVAHNFGDVQKNETQGHMIPNLAAKVKNTLGIKNSGCFAFDVLFGCPGWLLALDQAHQYIQNSTAKSVLVIGVESLSRVVDPNDIDAMLFGDGAGAAVIKAEESNQKRGILGYSGYSDCIDEIDFLKMDKPRNGEGDQLYVRMTGRSVFKYAVNRLPQLITECMNSLSISIKDISTFIFHQANGKMLDAIGAGLSEMNGGGCIKDKTPLTLNKLGNTSVATIPTLLDLILRDKMDEFKFQKDQKVVMASVGAGMHANCMVYQF